MRGWPEQRSCWRTHAGQWPQLLATQVALAQQVQGLTARRTEWEAHQDKVSHLKRVGAYQLLYLIRHGGGVALADRQPLLDPRHSHVRSGQLGCQGFVP